MSRLLVVVLFCLLNITLNTSQGVGQSGKVITWMEADMPPFFIQEGSFKGQGYGDIISAIIQENLPQYEHQVLSGNVARHNEEFKQKKNVCTIGYYKTPAREEYLHFSIPSTFTLPSVLIIKKEKFQEVGGKVEISLASLMQGTGFIVGLAKDRSYGPDVDEVINRYSTSKNTFVLVAEHLSRNLFAMLMLDRVDSLIAVPEEAMYITEELGIRDKVLILRIEENQKDQETWFSHVACAKTDWGLETIEHINKILVSQRPTQRYRSAYEKWLDSGILEEYRRLYKQYFTKAY